jgi:hypothetical protein
MLFDQSVVLHGFSPTMVSLDASIGQYLRAILFKALEACDSFPLLISNDLPGWGAKA